MPAISNQQKALNTNVSLSFSFLSFFFLSLLLKPEKVVKSTRSFTVHETNFFSLFLSFSEYIYVPIFGKVRKRKQFKMYLTFNWFTSQILIFYGGAAFL